MQTCRASVMSCAVTRTGSEGVTVGLDMYLCLKDTIPDILVALVFLTYRRQQR